MVLLGIPGWLRSHDPLASTSGVLALKSGATMSHFYMHFFKVELAIELPDISERDDGERVFVIYALSTLQPRY